MRCAVKPLHEIQHIENHGTYQTIHTHTLCSSSRCLRCAPNSRLSHIIHYIVYLHECGHCGVCAVLVCGRTIRISNISQFNHCECRMHIIHFVCARLAPTYSQCVVPVVAIVNETATATASVSNINSRTYEHCHVVYKLYTTHHGMQERFVFTSVLHLMQSRGFADLFLVSRCVLLSHNLVMLCKGDVWRRWIQKNCENGCNYTH